MVDFYNFNEETQQEGSQIDNDIPGFQTEVSLTSVGSNDDLLGMQNYSDEYECKAKGSDLVFDSSDYLDIVKYCNDILIQLLHRFCINIKLPDERIIACFDKASVDACNQKLLSKNVLSKHFISELVDVFSIGNCKWVFDGNEVYKIDQTWDLYPFSEDLNDIYGSHQRY